MINTGREYGKGYVCGGGSEGARKSYIPASRLPDVGIWRLYHSDTKFRILPTLQMAVQVLAKSHQT